MRLFSSEIVSRRDEKSVRLPQGGRHSSDCMQLRLSSFYLTVEEESPVSEYLNSHEIFTIESFKLVL
jgi:hypothetical protein